jgi:hypothetical protein
MKRAPQNVRPKPSKAKVWEADKRESNNAGIPVAKNTALIAIDLWCLMEKGSDSLILRSARDAAVLSFWGFLISAFLARFFTIHRTLREAITMNLLFRFSELI